MKEIVKATFVLKKAIFTKRKVQIKVAFQVTLKIGTIAKRRDAKENTSRILTSKEKDRTVNSCKV